jgi:hypothetical protein
MATPRVIGVDNGEVENSFGLCIARYYPEHDGVIFEEFIEVAPYQEHIVDLSWCYNEVILLLVQSFNILHVVYDRWEAGYAVSDLRTNFKVDARRVTLRPKDFDDFKDRFLGSRVWLPQPEVDPESLFSMNNLSMRAQYPRANFQVQLTTVNRFGRNVTKPDFGNDDLFRAAVLAEKTIMANKDDYKRGMLADGHINGPVAFFVGNSSGRGSSRGMGGRPGAVGGKSFVGKRR